MTRLARSTLVLPFLVAGCAVGLDSPPTAVQSVSPATFLMGSSAMTCSTQTGCIGDRVPHPVQITKAFQVETRLVSKMQFARCQALGPCNKNVSIDVTDTATRDQPYLGPLSDAQAYCGFLQRRVLTEAEWELAAQKAAFTDWGQTPEWVNDHWTLAPGCQDATDLPDLCGFAGGGSSCAKDNCGMGCSTACGVMPPIGPWCVPPSVALIDPYHLVAPSTNGSASINAVKGGCMGDSGARDRKAENLQAAFRCGAFASPGDALVTTATVRFRPKAFCGAQTLKLDDNSAGWVAAGLNRPGLTPLRIALVTATGRKEATVVSGAFQIPDPCNGMPIDPPPTSVLVVSGIPTVTAGTGVFKATLNVCIYTVAIPNGEQALPTLENVVATNCN